MPDPPHKYDRPPMGSHTNPRGVKSKVRRGHDGLFQLFKRDISEEEFQEQQKVKRGLEKTRTGFFQSIVNTLTNAQIDDDLYDQLEEQLILADVGPPAPCVWWTSCTTRSRKNT